MLEIRSYEFVKNDFLTHTANFGIESTFSEDLGSTFSEDSASGPDPGRLCEVCRGYYFSNIFPSELIF